MPLFFGQGYDDCILLMNVLSSVLLIIGVSNVIGMQYLLPTKQQTKFTISVTIGAIVNFVMNFILIPKYGALGASIGTITAELCVTAVQLYFVRKKFDLISIFKLSINYIIASAMMFGICYAIDCIIIERTLGLVLQIIFGGLMYLIVLVILKDKFLLDIIDKSVKPILRKHEVKK